MNDDNVMQMMEREGRSGDGGIPFLVKGALFRLK